MRSLNKTTGEEEPALLSSKNRKDQKQPARLTFRKTRNWKSCPGQLERLLTPGVCTRFNDPSNLEKGQGHAGKTRWGKTRPWVSTGTNLVIRTTTNQAKPKF